MERRKFLTIPLAAAAAPGALLAASAGSAQAAAAPAAVPSVTLPADTLKGFGHGGKDALALTQIKSLKLDWYYTWQARYYVTTTPPFVPMIKDAKRLLEQDAIGWVTRQLAETNTKHLLGFNEPDITAQANMSVDEAIRLWPRLMDTGLRLGSPVPAATNSLWLESFMAKAKAKGLRVDFMTMHRYAWPNAEDFLNKVTQLHEKYGKPVWVTEYAVADWNASSTIRNRYTRAQTEDFMRATVAGMRAMPFVERFAWKTRPAGDPVMGVSALFHTNGALTSTGRLYASL
ncbi:MAG TPA: glycosyl hydrolase [Arthrobacter sp.]